MSNSNTIISSVRARQLVDCKCRPLVEVDVVTQGGHIGRGAAPTGSSVGMYEAYVLRDGDESEYNGLSVHKAVDNVNHIIGPALIGLDVRNQAEIDHIMIKLDGTENKRVLGGNAIYSTSIACLRAAAACENLPVYKYLAKEDIKTVPIPSFNMINGGRYENHIQPFNEFILLPYFAKDIYEAVEIGVKVFQELENVLTNYLGHKPMVASSYGYAAPCEDPSTVLGFMQQAAINCGYRNKVAFAMDCASSEMYDSETNTYLLNSKRVSAKELIAYTKKMTEDFPIVFIEDLLDENDWVSYPLAVSELTRTIILGDDLIVTNREKLERALREKAVDGFILKPNQIGTITEALDTYDYAVKNNLLAITSGRSGGVIDDIVMDLATGLQIGFIKNGAPRSGERIEKLNFLMRACDLSPNCKLADISSIIRF